MPGLVWPNLKETYGSENICEMKDNIKTDIKKKKVLHKMDLCG
jgi:hypothetical protein